MKKLLSATACLLVSLVASPAFASIPTPSNQWQTIATTSDGKTILLDTGSVVRQGSIAGFWVQINIPSNGIARLYTAGDCNNKVTQTLWKIEANSSGQILNNEKSTSQQQRTALNSPLRLALDAACGFSPITDPNLASLEESRRINAQAISDALRITAEMFK